MNYLSHMSDLLTHLTSDEDATEAIESRGHAFVEDAEPADSTRAGSATQKQVE